LSEDEHFDFAHGPGEGTENVVPGGEGTVPCGVFGAQKIAHGADLRFDRGEGLRPFFVHNGRQRRILGHGYLP
jgi:hypothetical protein